MTSLADHTSGEYTKALYIGDSGTGKTGSLVSLVEAGYKLRILDMDNNLDTLKAFVKRQCPDKMNNVDYETRRDKYKTTAQGPVIDGQPKAYVDAMKLLDKWSDDTIPKDWGKETILVIDSLTRLSDAAFAWAVGMNPGAKEPRTWYGVAQNSIENVLSMLTSAEFKTNVIVISHIDMRERPDGTFKGYPNSIGAKLGPIIPTYFPTLVQAETSGSGASAKRQIKTLPTTMLDLKNPAPFTMQPTLPLETGLATLFQTLREN